jgi:copper(I)-binding protein
MLIGLKSPLRAGHKLPFALTVQFPNGRTAIIRELALIKPLEPATKPEAAQQHEHQHQ